MDKNNLDPPSGQNRGDLLMVEPRVFSPFEGKACQEEWNRLLTCAHHFKKC